MEIIKTESIQRFDDLNAGDTFWFYNDTALENPPVYLKVDDVGIYGAIDLSRGNTAKNFNSGSRVIKLDATLNISVNHDFPRYNETTAINDRIPENLNDNVVESTGKLTDICRGLNVDRFCVLLSTDNVAIFVGKIKDMLYSYSQQEAIVCGCQGPRVTFKCVKEK